MLDVFIYTICFCKESGPKKYIGSGPVQYSILTKYYIEQNETIKLVVSELVSMYSAFWVFA